MTTLPQGRYGSRDRPRPRWVAPVATAAIVLVGGLVSVVAYRNLGATPIEAGQTAFDVISDDSVKITFQVVRDDPGRQAVCVIRARSVDGDEAGRKEVLIQSNNSSNSADQDRRITTGTTTLRTSKRAVTGEVFGCSYQVPEYLSRK